jgi:hypothetical protein
MIAASMWPPMASAPPLGRSFQRGPGLWKTREALLAHIEGNAVRRAYARVEFWDERARMIQ